MIPFVPSLLLLLLLAAPALLTPSTSHELQVKGQRTPRDTKQDSIKMVISEGCITQGDSPDASQGGKEVNLTPGSPLVLTHKIKLVPSGSGSGSRSCGCEADFAALRERLERLEREVSSLREKCGGAEGGCCTSKESKGAGCSIKPEVDECPNECSDQGRCVDGKCVCFPGFSGHDCSKSNCPGNCNDNGRCVNGQCVCDPGFIGPDCSQRGCPDNCNDRGRCVNGKCVCEAEFTGPSCSEESCPRSCNNKGRCVNGQCECNPGFTGPDCSKKACPSNCSDRGRCVNGKCVCDSGFTGPSCSDKSCPENCNNRGSCIDGQCVCNPGFAGPDCSKRACPDNCNNHGRCVNGKCVCDSGFTGAECSEAACPGNCNSRGQCINGQCVCNSGFTGADCSEAACPGNCNGRGRCINGQCVCNSDFTGADCSEAACPGNCNGRGRCINGQCVCNSGFTGADCSEAACPGNCNSRGRCINGQCVCNSGFTGADCSEAACPGNCNSRGRCINGQCICNDGFRGPDCSERTCPNDCSDRGRCVNGKCVCDSGFTGTDCSEAACPGNCNSRGRCVNGQCVCNDGFSGLDCSERTCPNNCSERGRCVNGKCLCDSGFTGGDCSRESCPGNCNNRGRCIKGQCVCKGGFTGVDCSEKVCPKNCSNQGKCVNGKCVCDVGFSGLICAAKSCPANCNNKGRCIKGKCVCRQRFTGPDCSQCEEGMTGPNCNTVMSGVSQLSTRDITETAVTLLWTPPAVQYDTYYITFTSQKESDQQISVQVEGSLTTFMQTGLAAGQDYTVSITGELEGRKGAETSAEFMTLISGPTNLRVVKTTSMSAVVQWEQSQGEIDRYRLTVTPKDGAGRIQEMTVPAGQNSAHIQQLEAGRLYDIMLVAEKGTSQSEPATTQVTPGKTIPRDTVAALTLTPGQDVGDRHQKFNPPAEEEVLDQQRRREDGKEAGINGPDKDWTSVTAKTKPLVRKITINDTRPSVAERSILYRKPNASGSFRFNTTRLVPGLRKFGLGPMKKPPMGQKKKTAPLVPKKRKPDVPMIRDKIMRHETMRHPSIKASSTKRGNDKNPTVMSETGSDTNRQSSPDEPTVAIGSKEQPDIGTAGQRNSTAAVSSELTGTVQSQDKKCMNKIKLTHFRFPQGRSSGCKGDGTVLVGKKMGSDQGSSETDDLKLSLSPETDLDYSPDSLRKLMTDTFDDFNTTTFSVYLSKPSNLSVNAERATKQILGGLKPLLPSSSRSSPLSPSQSSSSSESSTSSSLASSSLAQSSTATPSPSYSASSHSSDEYSSLLQLSPSALTSHSPAPSSSTVAPSSSSPILLISSPSLLPSPSSRPSSSFLSSSDKSGPVGISELDVDDSKRLTEVSSPEDRKLPLSGKGGAPLSRRRPAYVRRLRPNFGLSNNKTRINWRVPPNSTSRFNLSLTSTSQLSSLPSSSVSEDSSSVKVNVPVKEISAEKDRATPAFSRVEQTQKKMQTERVRIPVRRPPPKGEYLLRRPNFGPVQNRTRPNLRLPPPSHPLNPIPEIRREEISSTEESVKSSLLVSKEPYLAEGPGPIVTENEDRIGTRMSTDFNQTLTGSGTPSSHHPATKLGYFRRLQLYGRHFQNRSRTNLRPPQHPHRVPMRKPFPTRKLNGSATVGGLLRHENDNAPDIPDTHSGGQGAPMPTQRAQISRSEEQDTAEVSSSSQTDDITARLQFNKVEGGNSAPMQTNKSGEEEASAPYSNSDTHKVHAGKNISIISPGGPTVKQTSSDVRHGAPIPATLPKTQSPTRRVTAPHPTQIRHYNSGSKIREKKINNTGKRLVDRKPEQTKSADSKPHTGSDGGVTREPLDHVGVTNRTSNGFTLLWDSPQEKYKNFVVTSKVFEKDERPPQKKSKKDQDDSEKAGGSEEVKAKHKPTKETESEKSNREDENRLPESVSTQGPRIQSSAKAKPVTGSDKTFKKVLPGSARFFQFENLPPQTEYTVTLLGKGRGLLSRLHKLVISTELKGCGALENCPEPPSNIVLSDVTENSLTVSWTKPNTPISGFKVTYTHSEEGEPVSMSVDSDTSTLDLSQLSPGSSYEVNVISILGLDESDPIKDFVMTLPDSPTKLQVLNVTDTKALLLWRPALATVDKYAIVYGSGTDSELRITVSGNAAEHQLSGLEGSTTYTVTITSQLGSLESSAASTSFTTTGGSGRGGDSPHDLQVNNVSPRTALLSWKPPSNLASSYRLTYQTDGQEMKEVTVDASVTEYNLTRLHPGSKYMVQLQAEEGGQYTAAISTDFTTGTLRFPFPTDCSQELLNGIRTSGEVEIFPQGKQGTPLKVYCDMETDGGGWTVFQRRKDGTVDFFRGWKDYTEGFGSLSGEFWLGLDNLHNLTAMTRMSLRVDLRDKDEAAFAKYSTFEVLQRNYKLNVGGYSGTAGDSLSYHNQRIFSTKDRDPMPFITRCAMSYRGGWWYKNCHEANLNGLYGTNDNHQGVIWTTWRGKQFSIPFTEMKMRPAAFSPPTRG